MKVQWQLIDVNTKEVIASVGSPFELNLEKLADTMNETWITGTGGTAPVGILNFEE